MQFVHESVFAVEVEALFAFHERPDAFSILMPPWETVRNVKPASSLEVGAVARLEQRVGPIWIEIVAEHVDYEKNRLFVDEMRKGPFAAWRHEHRFEPDPGGSRLIDAITYEPPLGFLGRLAAPLAIEPRLRKMFEYRHRVTQEALAAG
ncbi:MAG: SRPBCC family protein [Nannocystaceae bacterium]|nr:SRPBCC family protein [bacterium]